MNQFLAFKHTKTELVFKIFYNCITDILAFVPNIRKINYSYTLQAGISVAHFSENQFEFYKLYYLSKIIFLVSKKPPYFN